MDESVNIFKTLVNSNAHLISATRSKNALEKLKALSQPDTKVVRESKLTTIKSEEIVVGDYVSIDEGSAIPADGKIIQSNDFSVNESILTGESFAVFKDEFKADKFVYNGTTVASGSAIVIVGAIGNSSKIGTIGSSLVAIKEEKTPETQGEISNMEVKKSNVENFSTQKIEFLSLKIKNDNIN